MEIMLFIVASTIILLGVIIQKRLGRELVFTKERLANAHQKIRLKSESATLHEDRITAIAAFSAMLNQALDVQQVIRTAIDMVLEIMRVEAVILFSLDNENEELRVLAFEGINQKYASVVDKIKLGKGTCGQVALTGQPVLVRNIVSDPVYGIPEAAEENLQTQMSVPLQSRGRIIGTVCAATRSARQFTQEDIELLTAIGNLIGIAIENSELCYEKDAANLQLSASEEQYRQLFENAHDAIWVQNLSGKIVAANQACAILFGYALPELTGASICRFIEQNEFGSFIKWQSGILHGQSAQQPYKQSFIKADGTKITIMISTNLLSRNGCVEGLQFIGRDITNELRMQENQQFYLKQITKAHEEERLRISRDLHDSTAQNLIGLVRQLEDFCQTDKYLPMPRLRSLWSLHERLKDTLEEIRQLSRDLRPSILDDLGLLAAVDWLVEQLQIEHKIDAGLTISGERQRFSPETEIALFRIIQEALRNIAKHSGATKAQVDVAFSKASTKVTITDNGKGLKLPSALGELSRHGKLGIDGMQTRARLIGGIISIESSSDSGTAITVTIPS